MIDSKDYDFFAPETAKDKDDKIDEFYYGEKILVVDDEKDIHTVTKLTLQDFLIEGKKIELLSAYSASEARSILRIHRDISLVLLDVVMENDTSGLELVNFIRNELNNKTIRIILRTGQPGVAPERKVMQDFDIDDYRTKTELTSDRLFSIVKTGLNTFGLMKKMEARLIESQRKYKSMYENSPLSYQSLDMDGIITDVNPMWLSTMGYDKEEVTGQWFGDYVHPDSIDIFHNKFKEFKEKGFVGGVNLQLVKKDGSNLHITLEGELGLEADGKSQKTFCIFKDITKELQLEQELKRINNNYNLVVSNITTAVWRVDIVDGSSLQNIYISPVMDELLKIQPGSIKNSWENLKSFILPNFTNEIIKAFNEAILKPEEVITLRYKVLKGNGKEAWHQSQGRCFIEKNKKHFFGFTTDISAQKIIEERLMLSEERYRLATAASDNGIWDWWIKSDEVYFSDQWKAQLGYKPNELKNDFSVWKELLHPDHREIKLQEISDFIDNPTEFFISEFMLRHKNGSYVWISNKAAVVKDSKGKVTRMFGAHTDITERKNAEKIQSALYNISNASNTIESLPNFIQQIQDELSPIIDTTNFYVALYNEMDDIFSLPYMSDEKSTTTTFKGGNTLTKYVLKTRKPLLASKNKIKNLEEKGLVKSGGPDSEVWLGVPLLINKKAIGVIAVQSYQDENAYGKNDLKMLEFVSEQISISIHRKKTEQDLQRQNEEYEALNEELSESMIQIREMNIDLEKSKVKAEESDRLKSAFLANMSHEIRTPMNGILGFTNLLSKPNITGDQKEKYIDIIQKSGNRMLHTVTDLMDISMIEAGQMKVNIAPVNINEQCANLVDFFAPEANNKGIKLLSSGILNENESVILTDLEKFYAVVSNLTKNAIKYSHKGEIKVGCNREDQNIRITVEDTGIGIPKERLDAIFDRFVQADIEDKAAYEGSGLGLSISRAYVDMLGGNMWVESEEGIGSKFHFTIPYKPAKTQISSKQTLINEPENSIIDRDIKILIAEDEIFAFEYLKIILKEFKPTIIHAKTGTEAVDFCKNNNDINIVLMDIKMPGMDGYEATAEIRKFNKDLVIIAQTAYAQPSDRRDAINAGCTDYISKPIDKDDLKNLIEKYTSKSVNNS